MTPDLDRMLWQIAESGDPQAIARFQAANPHLEAELASRLSLVAGLRSMKPLVAAGAIPAFKPTALAPLIPTAWIATAIIGAGVLGTGSYFLTKSMTARPVMTPPTTIVQNEAIEQPMLIDKVVPPPAAPNAYQPAPVTPEATTQEPAVEVESGGPTLDLHRGKNLDPEAQKEAKYKFNLDAAPLMNVLDAVAKQSGLTLELAPGLTNPTVTVDVDGQTGIEVLTKLGKQYGFTPFLQPKGVVLIIPAVDGSGPTDVVGG